MTQLLLSALASGTLPLMTPDLLKHDLCRIFSPSKSSSFSWTSLAVASRHGLTVFNTRLERQAVTFDGGWSRSLSMAIPTMAIPRSCSTSAATGPRWVVALVISTVISTPWRLERITPRAETLSSQWSRSALPGRCFQKTCLGKASPFDCGACYVYRPSLATPNEISPLSRRHRLCPHGCPHGLGSLCRANDISCAAVRIFVRQTKPTRHRISYTKPLPPSQDSSWVPPVKRAVQLTQSIIQTVRIRLWM